MNSTKQIIDMDSNELLGRKSLKINLYNSLLPFIILICILDDCTLEIY